MAADHGIRHRRLTGIEAAHRRRRRTDPSASERIRTVEQSEPEIVEQICSVIENEPRELMRAEAVLGCLTVSLIHTERMMRTQVSPRHGRRRPQARLRLSESAQVTGCRRTVRAHAGREGRRHQTEAAQRSRPQPAFTRNASPNI